MSGMHLSDFLDCEEKKAPQRFMLKGLMYPRIELKVEPIAY